MEVFGPGEVREPGRGRRRADRGDRPAAPTSKVFVPSWEDVPAEVVRRARAGRRGGDHGRAADLADGRRAARRAARGRDAGRRWPGTAACGCRRSSRPVTRPARRGRRAGAGGAALAAGPGGHATRCRRRCAGSCAGPGSGGCARRCPWAVGAGRARGGRRCSAWVVFGTAVLGVREVAGGRRRPGHRRRRCAAAAAVPHRHAAGPGRPRRGRARGSAALPAGRRRSTVTRDWPGTLTRRGGRADGRWRSVPQRPSGSLVIDASGVVFQTLDRRPAGPAAGAAGRARRRTTRRPGRRCAVLARADRRAARRSWSRSAWPAPARISAASCAGEPHGRLGRREPQRRRRRRSPRRCSNADGDDASTSALAGRRRPIR